ncbi:MAG: DUF1588 domain-containing protein [Akkermansiaceae bacterium]
MKALCFLLGFAFLKASSQAAGTHVPGQIVPGSFDTIGLDFLEFHCFECHDDADAEADLNLMELGPPDETNTDLWKSIWAQVALKEMPPKKKEQPEVIERLRFTDWIIQNLEKTMADKGGFHAHRDPAKANFIDHDLLFSPLPEGLKLEPTSSPKRIWRITPSEHITRLNELINTEPKYDPTKPGLRTHGDAVSTNHGGELKLYFGVDRITNWEGGTVAYATAVKSIPVVLSSARKHGFDNYADLATVNSAETTQILAKAHDILKYMAYGPLSLVASSAQITDDRASYQRVKPPGDIRGLPSAITYNTKVTRPLTPVYHLLKNPEADFTDQGLREAIAHLFEMLTFQPPTPAESDSYLALVKDTIAKLGKEEGLFMGLSAIFLDRDALFRPELAEGVKTDSHGRAKLQNWELGLAVNHALSYLKPDPILRQAIVDGRMRSKEDVQREVTRMLDDDSVRKPRVLQFFRDYFDYDLAGYICKDEKALQATGIKQRGMSYHKGLFNASASTDRLIELILAEDKDVLKNLLTTQQVVASSTASTHFGQQIPDTSSPASAKIKKKIEAKKEQLDKADLRKKELALKLRDQNLSEKAHTKLLRQYSDIRTRRQEIIEERTELLQQNNFDITQAKLNGPKINARVGYMSFGKGSLKPERKLATAPEGQRLGILTHPSWLISQSDAMDNHAIHRGLWIQKRLLGGGVPDVPITVDAQLPDEPGTTLRSRMRVTREEYCWSCHQKMDPLGLPFEMYNHVGLYRENEHGKPVDTSGEIIDSGDPALDGPVTDALDLITKLSQSERVEQVFVRHAFRYWMGRNETLHDAPVLQAAHQAYRDNNGSMNALLTSLLTSDAFLYRKVATKAVTSE